MMQLSRFKTMAGAAAALALCLSPTMASAAASAPVQSISPLVAVSAFGTQASAAEICASSATAAAGAAVTAQGQPGCVLPAIDTPPVAMAPPIRAVAAPSGFSLAPVLLGLLGIAALAALIASSNDDSDSPVSPS